MLLRSLLLALLATPAAAGPFDGIWDISPEQCRAEVSDSRITIAAPRIDYWESRCEMARPTTIREMPQALLYDAACSGEGQTWTDRAFIALTEDDQLLIYTRGYHSLRVRCDQAPAPR